MIGQATIVRAGDSDVMTGKGDRREVIGGGRAAAGDVAWEMGGFVFYPGEASNRPPLFAESGELIIAYYDGRYEIRSAQDFAIKVSGSFENWPEKFMSEIEGETQYFVYSESGDCFLLVEWTKDETDDLDNKIVYYTGFDLIAGETLFTVSNKLGGGARVMGMYVEADEGKILWGGVWTMQGDVDEVLTARNYTNATCSETEVRLDDIVCSQADQLREEAWGALRSKKRTGAITTRGLTVDLNWYYESWLYVDYDSDGMSDRYPDGSVHPLWDPGQFTADGVSASVSRGPTVYQEEVKGLQYILAANPTTLEFIGKYSAQQIATTRIYNEFHVGYQAPAKYAGISTATGYTKPYVRVLDGAIRLWGTGYDSAYTSSVRGCGGIPVIYQQLATNGPEPRTTRVLSDFPGAKEGEPWPPDAESSQLDIVAIWKSVTDAKNGVAAVYQKIGKRWSFVCDVNVFTDRPELYPLVDAVISFGELSAFCLWPKVKFDGYSVKNESSANEEFTGLNTQRESVTVSAYGTGTLNGRSMDAKYKTGSGSGDNVYYIQSLTASVDAHNEFTGVITTRGTLPDGSPEHIDTHYHCWVSVPGLATFGGDYFSNDGGLPAQEKTEVEFEPSGVAKQVIPLPYSLDGHQIKFAFTAAADYESQDKSTLMIDDVDIPHSGYINFAMGRVPAGIALLIDTDLLVLGSDGQLTRFDGEDETVAFTGRCSNASLVQLQAAVSGL